MQEELKSTRNKYTLMREEVDVQRRKVDAKDQELFGAQHAMVDLQEELDNLRQQNKVIEGQKDALKTALKGEEVARIAAEGAISLPESPEEDEFASPRKRSPRQKRESLKENVDPEAPTPEEELMAMREALKMEKRMRLRADDNVHFLKMECQFQCCSCRVAERQGIEYVHDDTLAKHMGDTAAKIADEMLTTAAPISEPETELEPMAENILDPAEERSATPLQRPQIEQRETSEALLNFSPSTGTFYKAPSPAKPALPEQPLETPQEDFAPESPIEEPSHPSTPPTIPTPNPTDLLPTEPSSPPPQTPSFTWNFPTTPRPLPKPPIPTRTISHTTTTTIPLKPDDHPFSPAAPPTPGTPGGISRAEALEQIRQRRGRARSIAAGNGTPRKMMVEVGVRRDISAPAAAASTSGR